MRQWLLVSVVAVSCLFSCKDAFVKPQRHYTLSSFSTYSRAEYRIASSSLLKHVARMASEDKGSLVADRHVRSYYQNGGRCLWVRRSGVSQQADTLVSFLRTVSEMGFSPRVFRLADIEHDIQCLRQLDVSSSSSDINAMMARLEYNLTKAYLRYAVGQHFGFTNPEVMFNRLDQRDQDSTSTRVVYRRLYDVPIKRANDDFFQSALRKAVTDSLGMFLREIQPENKTYYTLLAQLRKQPVHGEELVRLLCNMERCRWRQNDYPQNHRKYVFVNLPAYHLWAFDGDSVLEMHVGCGTQKTKTPLLNSAIKRMEINPQWVIPHSILKTDIVQHAGDSSYFARHHYFIRHRKSGEKVDVRHIGPSQLLSGIYSVVQEGGAGNSLGRVVFRFDNNFSVFLHDTSTRAFFGRDNRGVSHGCVRVEKPFELAVFLLNEKDESLIDKIRYSMTVDLAEEGNGRQRIHYDRLIRVKNVEPQVPLFISYYTLYPDPTGRLVTYPDIYGYDRVMFPYLKKFL